MQMTGGWGAACFHHIGCSHPGEPQLKNFAKGIHQYNISANSCNTLCPKNLRMTTSNPHLLALIDNHY
jgi:hypothetical protein